MCDAVGYLIVFTISKNASPFEIWSQPTLLQAMQNELRQQGIAIHWDEVNIHVDNA
ncbi:MAG: hypothetical protein BSOLF_1695 [Candidatus Carbobacillus altaicus]|uniref:Uncharacterized protein n=1 Tax=Candidatus Carbonibacillus altaicus TaxID=2163959 RepID=A0A2R6Y3W9_9BACL|nr:MAG: hypothetical protein BSOLF_1695 [Candidatus Carbobacillus altaicus]